LVRLKQFAAPALAGADAMVLRLVAIHLLIANQGDEEAELGDLDGGFPIAYY
jgi:hypothetical protein|tara:strand:- start:1013 stop:1168 length:156 start_codon:yes stop_codon:yes gene_type:complete